MKSRIETYRYPNNEIQKVQVVNLESFDELDFFRPSYNPLSFTRLCNLYHDYIMPKYALVFGKIVLFRIPEDMDVPFPEDDQEYGKVYSKLTRAVIAFNRHAKYKDNEVVFDDDAVRDFYNELKERGCLDIAYGKRSNISFLPVGDGFGFLSECKKESKLKVNSSFFVMDRLDCGSIYDCVSTPLGLCLKDGKIINPPLFNREALLVDRNETISIRKLDINDVTIHIDDIEYKDKANCRILSRPLHKKTPSDGYDIIIVGSDIISIKKGGSSIPSSGFAIHVQDMPNIRNPHVTYSELEGYSFAIQVGNSAIIDGIKTERFISGFYNFLRPWTISYPPTFYPLNYIKDRAPRIVLGSDADGRPVLLWLEGQPKFGYVPGRDSCGASLSETADICQKLGIRNAVHLDGGGSAQIIINNDRQLMVSDRNPDDLSEQERAVSMGLFIK